MSNLPKNSFSRARQSMLENLQNNENSKTVVDIEADDKQDFLEDYPDGNPNDIVEPQLEKLEKASSKQKDFLKAQSVIKQPDKPQTLPTAKKTLALPMIYEFAVKELKARRNFAKQLRGEKGMETEEDIFVEIFRLFFSQPGESSDCLRVAQERMDLLMKESNY